MAKRLSSILEKNWLVNRIAEEMLVSTLERHASGRLLDIGCGDKPYEELTKAYISEHVGLDHVETMHDRNKIDLPGTAYDIPAPDGSFDTVLCTAVLEHLEEPKKALIEACRVLRKGGNAIFLVPLFWHLHEEPRDFFRYTRYGLEYLFYESGFEILELEPLSGFWVTFGQELVYYLQRFRRGGLINPLYWIIPPIGALIQQACYMLNKTDRSKEFTWMYLVVAKKR